MKNNSFESLFTLTEAASRIGADCILCDGRDPEVSSFSIDSRLVEAGSLFIALKGANADGHDFVAGAFGSGAAGVMVSREYYSAQNSGGALDPSGHYIVVEDTLTGFQDLAASWVSDFSSLIKIGVTGSSGKSTTKEILGAVLGQAGRTVMNKGNLNSETGLPLSVLEIRAEDKYGVFEMGVNHPGEMKDLVSVLKPDYSLITNIGTAHIGLLGSEQAIAKEKSDIFSLFDRDSVGFLPEGDKWLSFLKERNPGVSVVYGPESTAGVSDVENLGMNGWRINFKGVDIYLRLVGSHNLKNGVAAISVADYLGLLPDEIKQGIEKVEPLSGRSQILTGRFTVIEDSYNANLESLSVVLDFISESAWSGRVILVLGAMKELGSSSEEIHRLAVLKAASLEPDFIYLFGEEMSGAYDILLGQGYSGILNYTAEYTELEDSIKEVVADGDLVLLKGSRSMGLDRLSDALVSVRDGLNA